MFAVQNSQSKSRSSNSSLLVELRMSLFELYGHLAANYAHESPIKYLITQSYSIKITQIVLWRCRQNVVLFDVFENVADIEPSSQLVEGDAKINTLTHLRLTT